MIPEFENPSFINENDPDTIHERMMAELPADIDNMPGGFPWDFTRPTALEKAELVQYHLTQTLKLMFPAWAWDEWLDMHGEMAGGIKRREAGYATGGLTIEGLPGTVIKEATVFATPATDESSSLEFRTMEECQISEEGITEVGIIAAEAGTASNVAAKTITLMAKPDKAVTSVYNTAGMTGGTEEEDDESLRLRIQEANEAVDISFVGNDSDYIRWAKEVTGVGSVTVLPEDGGRGIVKLVVVDSNGDPASEAICEAVEEYIMSPDDRLSRKAPIGATLVVVSPTVIELSYAAKVHFYKDYERDYVEDQFYKNLLVCYEEAKQEGILKLTRVAAVLTETEGVYDFTDLTINGGTQNVPIGPEIYPRTVSIRFNEEEDADEDGQLSDE